jgi:hypothetical protein
MVLVQQRLALAAQGQHHQLLEQALHMLVAVVVALDQARQVLAAQVAAVLAWQAQTLIVEMPQQILAAAVVVLPKQLLL